MPPLYEQCNPVTFTAPDNAGRHRSQVRRPLAMGALHHGVLSLLDSHGSLGYDRGLEFDKWPPRGFCGRTIITTGSSSLRVFHGLVMDFEESCDVLERAVHHPFGPDTFITKLTCFEPASPATARPALRGNGLRFSSFRRS